MNNQQKGQNKRERSREKEELNEKNKYKVITSSLLKAKYNEIKTKEIKNRKTISIEQCISNFEKETFELLDKNISLENDKIKRDIFESYTITPDSLQDKLSNELLNLIKKMNKTTKIVELPKLPYGNSLSDREFLDLVDQCIEYSNFHLNTERIEYIKNRLTNEFLQVLSDLFKGGQYIKDLLENALLAILTSENETEQEDNFQLLKINNITKTPLVKMDFNGKDSLKLDKDEFIKTFSSYIYLKKFQKALKVFLPNLDKIIKSENDLKKYIIDYFNNKYIYFADLPQNVLALIIHTGNIYLKSSYLYEYYNEKDYDNQLIIREKIVLNLGHELMHHLIREISMEMKQNFLIKSNDKNNKTNTEIKFKDKFSNKYIELDCNESGNRFDHYFFNSYYFEELYEGEAKLFLDIKSINSLTEYREKLKKIIKAEKKKKLTPNNVNKFKKINQGHIRRCIRSRILGEFKVSEEEYNKIDISSESSDDKD